MVSSMSNHFKLGPLVGLLNAIGVRSLTITYSTHNYRLYSCVNI